MSSLSDSERSAILRLAREAVVEAVTNRKEISAPTSPAIFREMRGVFVTLHVKGKLQGCIGVISPRDSLGGSIVHCAISAALDDPRFAPMRAEQIPGLSVEVSLLSPLARIRAEEVEIGKHGLLIECGRNHGLLLPQVATEHNLSRERFLEETCHKAGLPRTAWKDPEAELYGFTCEVMSEAAEDAAK